MKAALIRISTVALLVSGVALTQACASTHQWGRSYPYEYGQVSRYDRRAFETGMRDGYDRGVEDLRHGRRPDVTRQKWYRKADRDYDHHYGPKEQYRVEYRRGFERGYDRAYREAYRGWRR